MVSGVWGGVMMDKMRFVKAENVPEDLKYIKCVSVEDLGDKWLIYLKGHIDPKIEIPSYEYEKTFNRINFIIRYHEPTKRYFIERQYIEIEAEMGDIEFKTLPGIKPLSPVE